MSSRFFDVRTLVNAMALLLLVLVLSAGVSGFAPRFHQRPGTITSRSMNALSIDSFLLALPSPELDGLQVVTICMDALEKKIANEALTICFDFSSDRCRAAVGGTLEEFMRYADNPVFRTLVNCDHYEILSVGPIIPGASSGLGSRRGEMQTFLVEIREGMSMKTVMKAATATAGQRARKRPTIEERLRERQQGTQGNVGHQESPVDNIHRTDLVDDGTRQFLWTLQKELRPPRQDCWLVHEVLFTKNAIHQTY